MAIGAVMLLCMVQAVGNAHLNSCRCPTSANIKVQTLSDDAMRGEGQLAQEAERETLSALQRTLKEMRVTHADLYGGHNPATLVYTPKLDANPPLEILMLNLITKNADKVAPQVYRKGFTVKTGLQMLFQTLGPICRVANVFASDRETLVSDGRLLRCSIVGARCL